MIKRYLAGFVSLFALSAHAYDSYNQPAYVSSGVSSYPQQECWTESVPGYAGRSSYGGAIIGGVAGGILGNQVGSGSGRTIASAVGAATGAIVGDRIDNNNVGYREVTRCRTIQSSYYSQPPRYQLIREPRVVYVPSYRVHTPAVREIIYVESPRHYRHDNGLHRGWYKHKHKHKHKHH